jgi:hypothetical protein
MVHAIDFTREMIFNGFFEEQGCLLFFLYYEGEKTCCSRRDLICKVATLFNLSDQCCDEE